MRCGHAGFSLRSCEDYFFTLFIPRIRTYHSTRHIISVEKSVLRVLSVLFRILFGWSSVVASTMTRCP